MGENIREESREQALFFIQQSRSDPAITLDCPCSAEEPNLQVARPTTLPGRQPDIPTVRSLRFAEELITFRGF